MNSKNENNLIYDGSLFCGEDDCDCGCPIVEFEQSKNMISIYDPKKPNNGKYYMTISEYNTLIKNAKPV